MPRRSPAVVASALTVPFLVLGVLAPSAGAEPDGVVPAAGSEPVSVPEPPSGDDQAGGLIITYDDDVTSAPREQRDVRRDARRAAGDAGPGVEGPRVPVEAGVESLRFEEPTTDAQARDAAAAVADLPGVAGVEVDMRRTVADVPVPDDPGFGLQWGIKDTYGSHANAVWPATRGRRSVFVAVIDTGSTPHPDLESQTVPGYDFITDPSTARDAGGRDADPSDEGDWVEDGECGAGSSPAWSSWHGTHVAGIVAARADDGYGVAGNAPGVRVQHVRTLGACGGYDSDIAPAIRWAAGGSVPGVPTNQSPADVINLSLSGPSSTCPAAYVSAISEARSRGATVVVAAGNAGADASGYTPANCPGVITVAATNRDGLKGTWSNGVPYTNDGSAVDLAAAGGSVPEDEEEDEGDPTIQQIVSASNTGLRQPGSANWFSLKAGTSMAAPAVSAAAALVQSHGTYSPDYVEKALRAAVQPFPTTGPGTRCTKADCGTGILDLRKLSLSVSGPRISGQRRVGARLTRTEGTWINDPASISTTWTRDGRAVRGAVRPSYRVAVGDAGKVVRVRTAGRIGSVPPLWRDSSAIRIAKISSATVLRARPARARYGRTRVRLAVTVRTAAGSPRGTLVLRDGRKRLKQVRPRAGRATVRLNRRALKRGLHRISATFVPSNSTAYRGSVSRRMIVRVR